MGSDWKAKDYHQNSQFQFDHALSALSHHAFTKNEHVLDVGCGDGKITLEIAKIVKNGTVVGIDNSKSMIEFAKNNVDMKFKNLFFIEKAAEEIDYENQFDLIVSFACLHWIKDQLAFLRGAKKALRKNAKVILNLYPKHPILWNAIDKVCNNSEWKSYFINYTNPHISYSVQDYKKLSLQAGFKIECLEESSPVAQFPNFHQAEKFLKSWLPHINRIPDKLKNFFIRDIIKLIAEESCASKEIGLPFKRIDCTLLNVN